MVNYINTYTKDKYMSSDLFLWQYKFYLKYINVKFIKKILRDFL